MFKTRDDEPDYGYLPQVEAPERNRYGQAIDLAQQHPELTGDSLNINGDDRVYSNPNRYKQHGFYFNADNCISCHACESACSEKNDLPPHLAFRAVGYVEGGTWPNYRRLNISMACNHCDNPVCLKGCPTRAYTKFVEYGAVLQDPDICFGCGYCTWVCPYNAPQLDPVEGQVQKCNMCVDRLEQGLKPACASACLAGALDFGVVETVPEHRQQLETRIPGFPTPDITHPNIRFQQIASLPREMTRTDNTPVSYERDAPGNGPFQSHVASTRSDRHWNLGALRSREDPLVIFTLATQAVIGAFLTLFLGPRLGVQTLSAASHPLAYPALLFALLGIQTFALILSTLHLGKPHRFYRAFNNLRHSPVSREVASLAVFYNFLGAYAVLSAFPQLFHWLPTSGLHLLLEFSGWGAALTGPIALYFMHRIYRIPARPFWNHWQVLTAFYGSMLTLGGLLIGSVYALLLHTQSQAYGELLSMLALPVFLGLLIEAVGLAAHARQLHSDNGEAAAAQFLQRTRFGKSYRARNAGLLIGVVVSAGMVFVEPSGLSGLALWLGLTLLVLITSLVGRALFYVLVVPTTMPGAFFWRNPGFQEHARQTHLAEMPQVGVTQGTH